MIRRRFLLQAAGLVALLAPPDWLCERLAELPGCEMTFTLASATVRDEVAVLVAA